jgi:large repetitive protein
VRRRAALTVSSAVALLLIAPRAPGLPDVPGDPTPPVVTPVISGTLGSAGWYTSNVTVNWSVTDPESIILSTTGCNATTLTANTLGTQLSCSAESDGGTTSVAKTFKVDKTPPAATASPSRGADANGWYNHPLSVSFTATDGTSGVDTCSPPAGYAGPDTAGTAVAGTCRDQAGNTSPVSQTVQYDATAPAATPAARSPDANGWFNHAVTVTFQGSDATSGIASCTQQTYSGPDDPSVAIGGTCTDRAGNVSAAGSFTLKYDETAPVASATPSRGADVNGWHNHPLTVSFAGSDATSGLDSCDAPKSYAGPDSSSAAVSGACRDRAGNASPRSFAFKYDATAPAVTATPARAANANGWYSAPIAVSFAGSDPVSGVASCSAAKTYSGPDSAAADVTGTCTDAAGNLGSKALALKYDATAPQVTASAARAAGATGWYTAPVAIGFAATDGTSGVDACDADKTYSGPDSATAAVGGACRDKAGNSGSTSLPFKYDATKPTVTAAPSRPAGTGGWYSAPVSVSFTGSDATSGLDTCDADKTYSGPDTASTAVGGACRDKAGNTQSGQLPLKYDATAPQVTASASRPADANGWYNHALSVSFSAVDATAGVDTCDAAKSYSGPDSAAATVTGSCLDMAGNAASAPLGLKYDATAPAVTGATPSRPPDADAWYNQPVSLQFQGADGMSGLASCTKVDYAGPDSGSASVSGSCADRAGNTSIAASSALKYDATAPAVTATPGRPADANGWYNQPLSVSFAGTDPISGVKNCDAAKTFSGPDSASTSVQGTCRDNAGNAGSGSVALKYDSTDPAATATASRPPNQAGWYAAPLSVSFAGSDTLSGLASCDPAKTYNGPDSAAGVASGTCRDQAGNTRTAALTVKYDATPPAATADPAREPDSNGWYNHAVAVGFGGTDTTSGIASCSGGRTYAGPDTASVSFSGSCRDQAGNDSAPAALTISYDATAPQVSNAVAVRPPDRAGWYNRPIAFAVQAVDSMSGVDSCPPVSYAGPDDASASFAASCADRAGNRGVRNMPLRYDATPPATTATADRSADSNGWYNRPFDVSFAGEDGTSGLESCNAPEHYAGPDSQVVVVGGACTDRAGNVGLASVTAGYDATAPTVTGAQADRPPDANGWYNHPLAVAFHGADATSQIEECSRAGYGGPDTAGASVAGSCRDRAGNSSSSSFPLRYDGTAPSLGQVGAKAGNGTATLTWTASADTALVRVRRGGTIVYTGGGTTFTDKGLNNGVLYRYTVTASDEAANAATSSVAVRPTGPLVAPVANAVVSSPPRLAWKAVPKATYYNVQLWRRGRILSLWPRGTSLQLPRRWTYNGRRYRLTDGRYRWYVWPGYGRRAEKRFGKLLGSSSFVVR